MFPSMFYIYLKPETVACIFSYEVQRSFLIVFYVSLNVKVLQRPANCLQLFALLYKTEKWHVYVCVYNLFLQNILMKI